MCGGVWFRLETVSSLKSGIKNCLQTFALAIVVIYKIRLGAFHYESPDFSFSHSLSFPFISLKTSECAYEAVSMLPWWLATRMIDSPHSWAANWPYPVKLQDRLQVFIKLRLFSSSLGNLWTYPCRNSGQNCYILRSKHRNITEFEREF